MRHLTDWLRRQRAQQLVNWGRVRNGKVLDYGCGAGAIIAGLRQRGADAYGCDVYYEGNDISAQVPPALYGSVIRRFDEKGDIPFEDATFDIVLHNQVIEHIEDIDAALGEMARARRSARRFGGRGTVDSGRVAALRSAQARRAGARLCDKPA